MLMSLVYYIPHWTIARDIIDYLDSKVRIKAIDIMLFDIVKVPLDYIYPAFFIDGDDKSTISDDGCKPEWKTKHANMFYHYL